MKLNDFRIGTRLGAGFVIVLALAALLALIGVVRLNAVAESSRQMVEVSLNKERLAEEWFRNLNSGIRRTSAIAKSADPSLETYFSEEAKASTARSTELLKAIEAMAQSDEEKRLLAEIQDKRRGYLSSRDAVMKFKREGNADEANRVFEQEFVPKTAAYVERMQTFLDLQRKSIDAAADQIGETASSGRNRLLVVGALVLLLGAAFAWWLTRSITQPITRAADLAQAVAQGDLTRDLQTDGNDELAALVRAMATMNRNLQGMVAQVQQSTESIRVAAAEIATGNQDLSSRTENQASSLQQTASSMEQLTGTVRQNADSAQEAARLAASASGVAAQGGTVVRNVVSTMEDISASSKKIADIIGVIDGIAFQTNILALNAAVEAARAGEQGRGFAVVASEVRNLAQRSAQAAKEIKSLIVASVEKVGTGTELVENAGKTMDEIVASVKRVTDLIGEISAASREQAGGIAEVGQAVNQMDQATQQNAALVEESAAAAQSLRDQAERLGQAVSVFKLRGQAAEMAFNA